MHPILAQKERFILYLAGWLLIAGLIAVLAAMSGALQWVEALVLVLPMSVLYAFMCLAALYVCRAFPLQTTHPLKLAAVYIVASFLSSSFWLLIVKGWVVLLARVEVLPALDAKFDALVPIFVGSGVLLYLLAAVVHYLILAFESSREAERKALELHALAREAEVKALKAQIQPHFLFNSLNSISALTTVDPAKARDMSLRLAEFLRRTLKLASTQTITLDEEVALIQDFIAIEQVRFGSRLAFSKRIDDEALPCLVPPLLLQPLIENAIKHGIANLLEGGTITLEAHHHGSRLVLFVTNPFDSGSDSQPSKGVGLNNVRGRLSSVYGNEARLDTQKTDGVFRAEISVPVGN
jgi:two-component system sensor histidine kinase AlgZ